CTRLRTTAPPTALLTTKPTLGGSVPGVPGASRITPSDSRPARRPLRMTRPNSALRRMRLRGDNNGSVLEHKKGTGCLAGRPAPESTAAPWVSGSRSGWRAPSCGGRRRSRGRHGSACAAGNRGTSHGAGCSAGTYACSLLGSRASKRSSARLRSAVPHHVLLTTSRGRSRLGTSPARVATGGTPAQGAGVQGGSDLSIKKIRPAPDTGQIDRAAGRAPHQGRSRGIHSIADLWTTGCPHWGRRRAPARAVDNV